MNLSSPLFLTTGRKKEKHHQTDQSNEQDSKKSFTFLSYSNICYFSSKFPLSHVTLKFMVTKQVKNSCSKPSFLSQYAKFLVSFIPYPNLEGKLGKKKLRFFRFFTTITCLRITAPFFCFFFLLVLQTRLQAAKPEVTTILIQESPTEESPWNRQDLSLLLKQFPKPILQHPHSKHKHFNCSPPK